MTTDIDKLSGQALRDAVCEQVLEWHIIKGIAGQLDCWYNSQGEYEALVRTFLPDLHMDEAWRVVEKMKERFGCEITLRLMWWSDKPKDCSCEICMPADFLPPSRFMEAAMPLAICRAALVAVQGDK